MSRQAYVAFDLGAESGRSILAILDGDRLTMRETHRFANLPQRLPSGLHWNLLDLWANLIEGLKRSGIAARQENAELISLGVDTWGVDFGLIGRSGELLGLPFAYRDERNPPAMAKAFLKLGADAIYSRTGIQHMPFNSIYQLIAQHDSEPALLANARHMLLIPDLLHYFFSGCIINEATIASSTGLVDPHSGTWATSLADDLGLPHGFLGAITPAGTRIGKLRDAVAAEADVPCIDVIVPGSHDTASAVAAVPVDVSTGKSWAYLSSGTWSLMGVELDEPNVSPGAFAASFTNERGVGGKIRFLKNISGLWLVQECRRDMARQGQDLDYPALTKLAADVEPFRTLVDCSHAPFGSPGNMLAKIGEFARKTGQPEPQTPGQFVRCCLESLAMTYRLVMDDLQSILGTQIEVLHIVGGGGQNQLLNQMTADALGKPVVVGPYEATAIGNALTQAIGHGQIENLAALRRVVRASFELRTFVPRSAAAYEKHVARYAALIGR